MKLREADVRLMISGEIVRWLRDHHGFSQSSMSAVTKLTQTHLSRIESGERSVSDEVLTAVSVKRDAFQHYIDEAFCSSRDAVCSVAKQDVSEAWWQHAIEIANINGLRSIVRFAVARTMTSKKEVTS